jgi:hypothetical protein
LSRAAWILVRASSVLAAAGELVVAGEGEDGEGEGDGEDGDGDGDGDKDGEGENGDGTDEAGATARGPPAFVSPTTV